MKYTLCLMTCGELTERECLDAIAVNRHNLVFQEVRNITPQITALNRMLDQCETEYLVPLDSDMVLNPDFFQRIKSAVETHEDNPKWHSILFPLWDTLTEQRILALKVLRMSAMRECPFRESSTPDVNHYTDLTKLGYTCIHDYLNEEPIGNHIVRGPYFCYMKYKDVYQTMRSHRRIWCSGVAEGSSIRECAISHFNFFMSKYNKTKNDDYKHCIAGMLDGLTAEVSHKSKSLNSPTRIDIERIDKQFLDWLLNDKNPELMKKLT